eukprot:2594104-Amphidinium_carterae.1
MCVHVGCGGLAEVLITQSTAVVIVRRIQIISEINLERLARVHAQGWPRNATIEPASVEASMIYIQHSSRAR